MSAATASTSISAAPHSVPPYEKASNDPDSDEWPIYDDPCGDLRKYDDLLHWWEDWHKCNGTQATDGNILISNYNGTYGETSGRCPSVDNVGPLRCVAEGSEIGKLQNAAWDERGCDKKYSQMYATVLHEIGHCIIKEVGEYDCQGGALTEEYMGDSYYDSSRGDNYTSPMVTWPWDDEDTDGKNECCDDLTVWSEPEGENKYWECFERPYSDCVAKYTNNC
jgi:hypothetical protein